jgi:predicted AAA+ superfamily ATPase
MRSGIPQQTVLSGDSNLFMGSVAENYIAQALTTNGYPLFYWASEHTAEVDFVIQKEIDIMPANNKLTGIELAIAPQIGRETILKRYIEKVKPY